MCMPPCGLIREKLLVFSPSALFYSSLLLFLGYKGKMVLFQDTLVTNPTISLVRKSEILA